MSLYSNSVRESLDAVEESSDGLSIAKFGSSVPFSVGRYSGDALVGKQKKGEYLSQGLKPEVFRGNATGVAGHPAEDLPGKKAWVKPSISKISILSTGEVTEGKLSFASSSVSDSQYSLHGFGEIEEQEVFELTSRYQVGRESHVSSMRYGRGRSSSRNSFELPRDNSSEREEEEEEKSFVPPHLLVQRDSHSLFERPCSKRMINWT